MNLHSMMKFCRYIKDIKSTSANRHPTTEPQGLHLRQDFVSPCLLQMDLPISLPFNHWESMLHPEGKTNPSLLLSMFLYGLKRMQRTVMYLKSEKYVPCTQNVLTYVLPLEQGRKVCKTTAFRF